MLSQNYKMYIRAAVIGAAVFLLYLWIQSLLLTEEGRVRKCILTGKNAVETENLLACSSLISTKYHDKYENDRSSVLLMVKEFFDYYKKIIISIEKMDLTLNETKDQAVVEITVLVVAQPGGPKVEKTLEGEKGRFRVTLIKEDKRWLVREVEFLQEMSLMGQNIS